MLDFIIMKEKTFGLPLLAKADPPPQPPPKTKIQVVPDFIDGSIVIC